MAPYGQIMLTYTTLGDRCLLYFGIINAIIGGAAVPSLTFILGSIVTGIGTDDTQAVKSQALIMFYIGCAVFFLCWAYVSSLSIFSQRITLKTRVAYLTALLKQDISWYDANNVQELSSKMSKDINAIETAIGEKAGFIIFGISRAAAGFSFAFAKGWLLSLFLLIGFPIIGLVSFALYRSLQTGYDEYLKAYGQSAGYAEQAVSAIKVVHSYGQEELENDNYAKYLVKAKVVGLKQQFSQSLGLSAVSCCIFMFYGYAFEMGKVCVLHEDWKNNKGTPYDGGDVASCMLGIFIGAIVLGTSLPNLRSVVEGKVSGHVIYSTINRVPKIPVNDESKPSINKDKLLGHIEFKNVDFTYPTRPDQMVLRNFSA